MLATIDSTLKAIILGVIQAVTEFLPVSSSGHMVVTKSILGIDEVGITIEVTTHFATAVAVVIYLWARIVRIVEGVCKRVRYGRESMTDEEMRDSNVFCLVLVGSIPAAIAGFTLRSYIHSLFEDAVTTSVMLTITGCFVLFSGKVARTGTLLGLRHAIIIGFAQALAIVPGLSRSGLTIGTGLIIGLAKREAFEFSLLLSLPAIVGAAVLEVISGGIGGNPSVILAAAVPALVGGYLAISLLLKAIVRNRFHVFAYYLIPVGIALIVLRPLL